MWMLIRGGALALTMTLGTALFAEGDAPGVEGVIRGQLDAFLEDDFDRAFTFASPMIRNIFRTPGNFGAMVRQGYPMVWRPGEVRFGDAEVQGQIVQQRVIITDGDGAVHVLQYEMVPAGDGWQINGVRILRAPDVGA